MRFYLASNFRSQARLIEARRQLVVLGHESTATWLDESEDANRRMLGDPVAARRYALRDIRDITRADGFLLDTLQRGRRGGRHVELGIALAQEKQIIWRIGPALNLFHELTHRAFPSWDDAMEALAVMTLESAELEMSASQG